MTSQEQTALTLLTRLVGEQPDDADQWYVDFFGKTLVIDSSLDLTEDECALITHLRGAPR